VRENRTHGSEGGDGNAVPDPYRLGVINLFVELPGQDTSFADLSIESQQSGSTFSHPSIRHTNAT